MLRGGTARWREALALVWACEHFNMCIFGRNFELESKPSTHVEQWVLHLPAYDLRSATDQEEPMLQMHCQG